MAGAKNKNPQLERMPNTRAQKARRYDLTHRNQAFPRLYKPLTIDFCRWLANQRVSRDRHKKTRKRNHEAEFHAFDPGGRIGAIADSM
ncbi:MAG TPA: hypothetical protein VGH23_01775 [Rhizomicrobium sp.]|jgi:hypothetical protein